MRDLLLVLVIHMVHQRENMRNLYYHTLPLKCPCQISAHPHSCQKVLCRVNCTQTSAHCQYIIGSEVRLIVIMQSQQKNACLHSCEEVL